MTSRELADAIDHLVTMRITQFSLIEGTSLHVRQKVNDECERLKQQIADALIRLAEQFSQQPETPRPVSSQKSGDPEVQSDFVEPKGSSAPSTLTASDSPSAPATVADSSQIPTGRETRPTHDPDDIVP